MPGTPDGPSAIWDPFANNGTGEDEIADRQAEAVLGSLTQKIATRRSKKQRSMTPIGNAKSTRSKRLIAGRPLEENMSTWIKEPNGIQEQWRMTPVVIKP